MNADKTDLKDIDITPAVQFGRRIHTRVQPGVNKRVAFHTFFLKSLSNSNFQLDSRKHD